MEFPLTTWDQIAPRAYIRQVYCFELPQAPSLVTLWQTFRDAIIHACAEYPCFAARVALATNPPGQLRLVHYGENQAQLVVVRDKGFKYTYSELKSKGFPAGAFVGPTFHLEHTLEPGGEGIPVLRVYARLITGGLLLCIYAHHSVTDGIGMKKFIQYLSKYTIKAYPTPENAAEPSQRNEVTLPEPPKPTNISDLTENCPEYFFIPDNSGPLTFLSSPSNIPMEQIPKRGRIFIFRNLAIDKLKSTASNHVFNPSTFACLAALIWTCTTRARMQVHGRRTPSSDSIGSLDRNIPRPTHLCRLVLPASWSVRAFPSLNKHSNSVANAVTMTMIYEKYENHTRAEMFRGPGWSPWAAKYAYGDLVSSIMKHLNAIDEDYVATRTQMIRAAPDPRSIGVNLDPQNPLDFIMNSWRHLGGDTSWLIPGAGEIAVYPDAVRRVQNEWNMSAALVLPGRRDSSYQVLITLDAESMDVLCNDNNWMSWIENSVE